MVICLKNDFGGDSKILKEKLRKQSKKYCNIVGPGAFVFSLGFSSSLEKFLRQENDKNDVLLLDWNAKKTVVKGLN